MAKTNSNVSSVVQTTFTKQKRELAKANSLVNQIRAQEKRFQRFAPDGKLLAEERVSYLIDTPQALAGQVLGIVAEVVRQHGARQRANGANTGKFEFKGVSADLTVPQLRALQDAAVTLRELVDKLPQENRKQIPNTEVDGRPAFATPFEEVKETKTRDVPYREKDSTRVLTYQETYVDVVERTREVTIDYGLPLAKYAALRELVDDLDTAIQVAIDEANAKPHADDPVLNDVVAKVVAAFQAQLD